MNSLDELHTEMGRFLTESSYVENLMLLFVVVAQDRRPLEEAFVDFMGKTFGQKISDFKKSLRCVSFL